MLKVEALTKKFGGLIAVNNVSFNTDQSRVVGLIGPNGAGKTTVLNLITGFLKPSSGRVFFEGTDVTSLSPHVLAKKGVVRTFQHTSVFPNLTVYQNVEAASHSHKSKKRIYEILCQMKLEKYHKELASALPYGVQRRLEIAIGLAVKPKLLLLDEPAAGMNPEETLQLIEDLNSILKGGLSLVIVDHNMKFIANICDKIIVLHQGKKITEGNPNEVLKDPEVIRIYLGEKFKHAGN